jgi:hypothetical protein
MSKHSVFEDPVAMVRRGLAVWEWVEVIATHPELDEMLSIRLMKDAMKLPDQDGQLVRFCVDAKQQQKIADLVGGVFHSTRTADLRHVNATIRIDPVVQIDGRICALSTDKHHSSLIDEAINTRLSNLGRRTSQQSGLVSTVGKPWTLTQQMVVGHRRYGDATAFNYGWHDSGAPSSSPGGLKLWQPIISANSMYVHNDEHSDPSQVCEFPSNYAVLVKGQGERTVVNLSDMYQDGYLWKLVSYEGPLGCTRQLSVPRVDDVVVLPPDLIEV